MPAEISHSPRAESPPRSSFKAFLRTSNRKASHMKDQFTTLRFWIEMAGAAAVLLIVFFASLHYNKTGSKEWKVEFFRIPTSNALIVLGLLVPTMVALASYLYINNPEGKYSSLLATIVVMFLVLVFAIWETFALLKKGDAGDKIKINFPEDRRFITTLGFMYGLLLLGLFYFALFFLFELPPKRASTTQQTAGPADYYLAKPHPRIDQTKDEILSLWGQPTGEEQANRILIYASDHSIIRLAFDENQKLVEISNRRK